MNISSIQKAKLQDSIARVLITVLGTGVILAVVTILVLMVRVALPLFEAPLIEPQSSHSISLASPAVHLGVGTYGELGFLLEQSGQLNIVDLKNGQITQHQLGPVDKLETYGDNRFSFFSLSSASSQLYQIQFLPQFDAQGNRTIKAEVHKIAELVQPVFLQNQALQSSSLRQNENMRLTQIWQTDHQIWAQFQTTETDFLGNQTQQESEARINTQLKGQLQLALSQTGEQLYIVSRQGQIERWSLIEAEDIQLQGTANTLHAPITALSNVFGDVSVAVGNQQGSVEFFFPKKEQGEYTLQAFRQFPQKPTAIHSIQPSLRNKSLLIQDEQGQLYFDYLTNQKSFKTLKAEPGAFYALSSRGKHLAILNGQQLEIWRLEIDHPEFSLSALFGKIWYEDYAKPDYIWQSSSGSDDFEPKFSFVPLVFGSLKSTFYGMAFAWPLAILGAIYTSQFASTRWRGWIKPTIEIMAALPSVILGFLAALWLAPIVEQYFIPIVLLLTLWPVFFWGVARLSIHYNLRQRWVKEGSEFWYSIVLIFAFGYLLISLNSWFLYFFGGDFQQWLTDSSGIVYEQRNSMVIGFALGFAVLPIIFTISEDAISSVPKSLHTASLALGASRWQTVYYAILPAAMPGIFAATIIGFGRAIGETMIVLMATGNTPILDFNIFNGMRSLAANIAVEIPEAPMNGTLYRLLFLSAGLLFAFTFTLNALAEFIRQNLRKKYGQV